MNDKFTTARAILTILEYVGWAAVAISMIAGFITAEQLGLLPGILGGLIASVFGFLIVGIAQMGRAQIVTAEATQEMAAAMRKDPAPVKMDPTPRPKAVKGSVGMVKVFKDVAIYRTSDGSITAGGTTFDGVLAAEKAISAGEVS